MPHIIHMSDQAQTWLLAGGVALAVSAVVGFLFLPSGMSKQLKKSARIGLASISAILFFVAATANTAPEQASASANSPVRGTPSTSPTFTGTPSGSTTAQVIRITSPTTGTIEHTGTIIVAGTTTQPLVTGHEIWIVVQAQGTGRYYPQWPPATVAASGDWTAPTVALGGIDTFLIDVVNADPSVIAAFKAYLQQNQHSFPGMVSLPTGGHITDSVTIVRQ
jgi:hypothetical protein